MRFSFCRSEFSLLGIMMVFRKRCHANMICVGVALYFSAKGTINGSLRTMEYPIHFEQSVCSDVLSGVLAYRSEYMLLKRCLSWYSSPGARSARDTDAIYI